MLSRTAKAAFYAVAGPLMTANGAFYRLWRAPRRTGLKVQLGPGQEKYLPGWINVDANMWTAKADVWADLRNRLPFRDGTVAAMYSHHVIEHLPDLWSHFRDVFRCLQPGGVYRVGGPNGDSAIAMFTAGRSDWFWDFPDPRKSLGGRLENFIFCRQEHLTILTESYLREILEAAGFIDIRVCLPIRESGRPDLFANCMRMEFETHFDAPHTLVMEAAKPLN